MIFEELDKFNGIKYTDSTHKYLLNGVEQMSVTTFIGKFKPKFDTEAVAKAYALKHNLIYEDVISSWDYTREYASIKGRTFHSYAENWYANKVFEYDEKALIDAWGLNMPKAIDKMIQLFYNFYNDSKNSLIPIKSELVVGDPEYNISGTVDQLFYNKKHGEYQIFDWKTNKDIRKYSDFGKTFNHPISHLEECEFNTYSLQLTTYKRIIERNTNIKIGKLYIVWFNELNDKYQLFQCDELNNEFDLMVENKKTW